MQLAILFSTLAAVAVTTAHDGMVDLPGYKDVGVIFAEGDFQGETRYLIEAKDKNQCLPLALDPDRTPKDVQIGSLQICMRVNCAIYTGDNCADSVGANYAITTCGPHDATALELPEDVEPIFRSYICGASVNATGADQTLSGGGHMPR